MKMRQGFAVPVLKGTTSLRFGQQGFELGAATLRHPETFEWRFYTQFNTGEVQIQKKDDFWG